VKGLEMIVTMLSYVCTNTHELVMFVIQESEDRTYDLVC